MNLKKADCPQCRDLPEGEVVVGHDHRQFESDPRKKTFVVTDLCMWEKNKKEGTEFPHSICVVDKETGQMRYIKGGSEIRFLAGEITEEMNQKDYNKQGK